MINSCAFIFFFNIPFVERESFLKSLVLEDNTVRLISSFSRMLLDSEYLIWTFRTFEGSIRIQSC